MDENFIRRFSGLSTNHKKSKIRLVKRKGKLVKVVPKKEEEFKKIFDKYFPIKYHYAYNTAVKHLINKPKRVQISELKRVVKQYEIHMKNLKTAELIKKLKI